MKNLLTFGELNEEQKVKAPFTCEDCGKTVPGNQEQTIDEDYDGQICKDCADKMDIVSNCCGERFASPGWPDNDICSSCKEHAGPALMGK